MANEFKQASFRQSELNDREILGTLQIQKECLSDLRFHFQSKAAEAIIETASKLDTELLIYACSRMVRALNEAATADCAQLIAASVTRPGEADKCQDDWAKWLEAALCWPGLAQGNWFSSQSEAMRLIIDQLGKKERINLDSPEGRDIVQSVRGIQLVDLVEPEIFLAAFPEAEKEDREGGDGTGEESGDDGTEW